MQSTLKTEYIEKCTHNDIRNSPSGRRHIALFLLPFSAIHFRISHLHSMVALYILKVYSSLCAATTEKTFFLRVFNYLMLPQKIILNCLLSLHVVRVGKRFSSRRRDIRGGWTQVRRHNVLTQCQSTTCGANPLLCGVNPLSCGANVSSCVVNPS